MKSKIQKKEAVKDLDNKLSKANIIVFTSFAKEGEKGLNTSQMQTLKKSLRSSNSEYVVGKKRLIDVALKNNPSTRAQGEGKHSQIDIKEMEGSVGVVFGYDDALATSKALYDFSKTAPALRLLSAIMGSEYLSGEKIIALGKLPSREVLLSRLIGMIQYPISGLVSVLSQASQKPVS